MKDYNKSDLAADLSDRQSITYVDALKVVNIMFDTMSEALVADDKIEIRGFGSFVVRHYKSYTGRNPRTGELVHVPEKKLPYWKMGKWFAVQLSPNLLTEHPTFLNTKRTYTPEEIQFHIKNPNHKHFHKKPVGRGGGI